MLFILVYLFVILIGYMLEVDQESRPDIYQVSYLAFKMANVETPVANLKVSIHAMIEGNQVH